MKLSQWTSCGFVAVMLDNRGSSNRGKKFESYLHVRIKREREREREVETVLYSIFLFL